MSDFSKIGMVYNDLFGGGGEEPQNRPVKQEVPGSDKAPELSELDSIDAGISEILPVLTKDGEISGSLKEDIDRIRKMVAEDFHLFAETGKEDAGKNPTVPGTIPGSGQIHTGQFTGKSGQTETSAAGQEDGGKLEKQEEARPPMEELEELIGLDSIKKDVKDLIDLIKMQQMRAKQGMKSVPVSKHLVFSGNPGTGKTTVARILARLYKEIGALSKGQLVEVDRSGLVAGFVGQTALRTQEKIQEAMGGVLFIDEAYTLAKEGNDFGQEAIDTILKAMEDNREDFVVIVAGYTDLMKKFINSNPGLKSRFNKYIEFPDYSADELLKIFELQCRKYEYSLTGDAKTLVEEKIRKMEAEKGDNFANARDVRNLFEQIVTRQATRVAKLEDPAAEELREVRAEDIVMDKVSV